MSDKTGISWTDSTFNAWIGCQKVSAGCDNCYAEKLVSRYGWTEWGAHGIRKRTSPANWRKPISWNRAAQKSGKRRRVFCASLADIFDNKAPVGAREDLWTLIKNTPSLDWQILTKRPENIKRFLPKDWDGGYPNVWLGISAEDQAAYNQRWPILSSIPAHQHFISYEPAIGHLTLAEHDSKPTWLIWGGESGPGARVMQSAWAADITAECVQFGIPVFGKQWGSYPSNPFYQDRGYPMSIVKQLDPPANGKGGGLLHGRLWRQFPANKSLDTQQRMMV